MLVKVSQLIDPIGQYASAPEIDRVMAQFHEAVEALWAEPGTRSSGRPKDPTTTITRTRSEKPKGSVTARGPR